jgi:predicted metal-dependent enzyme (double-stranded beta helix superfamily)
MRPNPDRRPPLAHLIEGIDRAVHRGGSSKERAESVVDVLRIALHHPRLLPAEHRRSSAESYRTNIVHTAADGSFSLVALVWLPGQQTPIHSHLSWCVVGVYEGEELETSYRRTGRLGDASVAAVGTQRFRRGDVSWLSGGSDIHRVENGGDGLAVSLHVYGLDYARHSTSIFERFDEPVDAA